MSDTVVVLTFVTAIGSAISAGIFYAFSTAVMKALAAISAPAGIAAMQSINVKVINPLFLGAIFGSGLPALALAGVALADLDRDYAPYLLAGGLVYVIGTLFVTMAFNVPRNNELAKLDPEDPRAAEYWSRYVVEWTRWNTVRTIAPIVSLGLFMGGLYVA
jgi:uncharacterized membrane protein